MKINIDAINALRLAEVKDEMARLKAELISLCPAEDLSVRQIASRSGISPATAQRFKAGKAIDIPTASKLIEAGFIKVCPCCSREVANGMRSGS